MTHELNDQVQSIIDNYLGRMRNHLKGLPDADREELVLEIYAHSYESYAEASNEDEVQRILQVLDRLGEPSEVVASRLSGTIKRMGRKRNLPFYILTGFLISIFGIPLGIGGLGLLLGLGVTLAALIFTYFLTAGVLVIAGWVTAIVTLIRISHPEFLGTYVNTLSQFVDPPLGTIFDLIAAGICVLLGLGMVWLGRHIPRGTRFLFGLVGETFRNLRRRARSAVGKGTSEDGPNGTAFV
jgi:uncharacterized membrane protein